MSEISVRPSKINYSFLITVRALFNWRALSSI